MANRAGGDADIRQRLIERGQQLLAFAALDGLRKAVSLEAVSKEAVSVKGVSKRIRSSQNVRRTYFDNTDDLVAAVVESVNTVDGRDFKRVADLVMTVFRQASPEERERSFVEMLRINYEQQFLQTVVPAAWVAHAAAAVYSESFTPPPGITVTREDRLLANRILAARRGFYGEMAVTFGGMLELALKGFEREPRAGFDARLITALMHALHDGMVLRELIEPGIATSATVAEAIFQLAWALSVPLGPRYADRGAGQSSDPLVNSAVAMFAEGRDATVSACAEAIELGPAETEEASRRFPTSLDLIDAAMRHVTRGELAAIKTVGPRDGVPVLREALRLIALSVTQHARLFAAATKEEVSRPTGALNELEAEIAAALDRTAQPSVVNAKRLARLLMGHTLRGAAGIDALGVALDTLDANRAVDPDAGS